jgi:hypothetical protein
LENLSTSCPRSIFHTLEKLINCQRDCEFIGNNCVVKKRTKRKEETKTEGKKIKRRGDRKTERQKQYEKKDVKK